MAERSLNTGAADFQIKRRAFPALSPIVLLPFSETNRQSILSEPINLSPIGERISLPSGAVLERPNPLLIAHLQAADPRVRYFSTDRESFMIDVEPVRVHHRAVSKRIGYTVAQDFPDEDIFVRGSVGNLTEPSPVLYWNRSWSLKEEELYPLTSVVDILKSGSDDGRNNTVIGYIDESGKMNEYTQDWLSFHYIRVTQQNRNLNLDQLFPILLVYKLNAFGQFPDFGWNSLVGDPNKRIAALYITDRVYVPDELNHL